MVANLIRRALPFSVKLYLRRNVLNRYLKRLTLTRCDKDLIRFFEENTVRRPILLSGFVKSGNTWARFVIFNYFNILKNNAGRTLTYDELEAIDCRIINDDPSSVGRFEPVEPGFPVFYHTHVPYRKIYDYFDKVLYVYRNPLDVALSSYHFWRNREMPFEWALPALRERLLDVDFYVLHGIYPWIQYHKTTIGKSDVVLCYEKMRADPYGEFSNAFRLLGFDLDEAVLRKSIQMSSFENVRKMGRECNQLYGMGPPEGFKGEFTRSGESRQYVRELKPETTETARRILRRYGIDLDV